MAWSYGSGTIDEAGSLAKFTAIEFRGGKIRGAGSLELTATGGRPSATQAAVRRWTAPHDGTVDITGELSHLPGKPEGDGVTCFVISSRAGRLARWTANRESLMTRLEKVDVKRGETIDFVTIARADDVNDDFDWAPSITMTDRDIPSMPGIPLRWEARTDFASPDNNPTPLGRWEELAQVMLISNEFALVD